MPDSQPTGPRDDSRSRWTFLTNHAHVLVCITNEPHVRLRDVADRVGITERAAQGIMTDLVAAGYLTRFRVGRRNRYEVHPDLRLRHPLEAQHTIGGLLELTAAHPTGSAEV